MKVQPATQTKGNVLFPFLLCPYVENCAHNSQGPDALMELNKAGVLLEANVSLSAVHRKKYYLSF